MKIALDYGGVLQSHEWIREMAKSLLKDGHEVYCISGVTRQYGSKKRLQEIRALNIPFTSIHTVYHDAVTADDLGNATVTDKQAFDCGMYKARVMKKLGCEVLIDDLPAIIVAVRTQGILGLHLA